jgi:hypothetical protein
VPKYIIYKQIIKKRTPPKIIEIKGNIFLAATVKSC